MAYSKINICNLALAMNGSAAIRDFNEPNKRARMAEIFFEPVKDYLLTKYDWPFARKFGQLNMLSLDADEVPEGTYAYQLPNDCKIPRDITPLGSRDFWEIMGTRLFCKQSGSVGLYYTAVNTPIAQFSDTFVNVLATGMAVKLAPPITQDPKLVREMYNQFITEQREAFEADANIGNRYREYDEDPNNDTFVNPDAGLETFLGQDAIPST